MANVSFITLSGFILRFLWLLLNFHWDILCHWRIFCHRISFLLILSIQIEFIDIYNWNFFQCFGSLYYTWLRRIQAIFFIPLASILLTHIHWKPYFLLALQTFRSSPGISFNHQMPFRAKDFGNFLFYPKSKIKTSLSTLIFIWQIYYWLLLAQSAGQVDQISLILVMLCLQLLKGQLLLLKLLHELRIF